jgi:Second Messenger Oligonucleotide or Dinucleotide Synthetase domain
MAVADTYLWEVVRSIEPTPTQKNGAARSQNYLRDLLNTGRMANRIERSYLSGSYARDTAIYPLDDVDIIFVINPTYWAVQSIFDPTPTVVLESFANAIRYRYPVSSVYGQRRSVRLQLFHLDIDVVPAIQDKENTQLIRIPDRNASQWIVSSPLRHSENATKVNQARGGRFKPLVKLLKYWNYNLPRTAQFKSFAIETMAVTLFDEIDLPSLQDGLKFFFDFIVGASGNRTEFSWNSFYGISLGWYQCIVMDAAGTGSNVTVGVNEDKRKRFVEHATRSRNKMMEASKTLSVDTAIRRVSEALKE